MDYFELYMIVLSISMLFLYPELIRHNNKCNLVIYLISSRLLLMLNSLLYKFSGDYVYYILYIDSIQSKISFADQIQLVHYNYEIGFAFLCWILKVMFGDSNLVYQILIFIPSVFLLSSFYIKSKIPLFSLVIYIAHFHWWMGLVLIRQLYALIFVLLAIWYLFNKRSVLNYCIFILIASLFHNSSLVLLLLPVYMFFNFDIKYQIMLILIFFIIGQIGVLSFAFDLVFSNISRGSTYANYLEIDKGLNYLAYLEKVLVFLLLIKWKNKLSETIYRNNLLFYSFALIVCGLFFKTEVASRLLTYFDIYIYVYIIPLLIWNLKRKQRIMAFMVVIPYLFFYLYRFIYITIVF